MDNNPIGELMQNTMESVKNILKVDTVVGDPIYTPDGITLVPISKISVGFGGGGKLKIFLLFNNKHHPIMIWAVLIIDICLSAYAVSPSAFR